MDSAASSPLPSLLPDPPPAGRRLAAHALTGSSDALALAQLAERTRLAGRITLCVCADPLDAARLTDEVAWFAPGLRVHMLPDWETLPYDHFSPHQDLVSDRLATLYQITQRATDLVLVPATTALSRFAPPAYLAAYTFFLKQGEKLAIERLRAQLVLAGYHHVTQVVAPGEFCV